MTLLQVNEVTHAYASSSLFRRSKRDTNILSGVSLRIEEGTCLGLLGASGAGKSTLGRVILGLEKPKQGQVLFQGHDLYAVDSKIRRQLRRDLQVVFQDCYSSVNPRMTAEQIIGEPLGNYESLSPQEQKRAVGELLERVGLSAKDGGKYPHQFSGGQLQRINIARAIALKPKMIVLDEAVSSLDMVHQTNILRLLSDLRSAFGLSYLFITHDIKAAYTIADALAVMEKGQVAEYCERKEQFLLSPHPAVRSLLGSMLSEHPRYRSRERLS
ncbi:oligopeptide ABC transporter ATP-binding protein [Paenibacillus mucilaginosus 3016]|uniref:Oligopeptide ABC transporter ATP-binding protein n=1 Tax=Paenibacillus mucilaginosus 3016 TaxID=1116391 RepID=H6NPG6_9BACL|nr:nickel import ATP-binding protein NikE [Paenibacillus mucilaginosus]AFC32578.1 oligopeptide ABC transporter ATP-binding protein [Paenibacillus mucilaginosus 3016]WFA21056.1 nickel import ATP-binding protein NikE [Paenibacillus mucilaginosus]